MLHDTRLSGTPRNWLFPPRDWGMRVPDTVLNSVVFLGRDIPGGRPQWSATGFLVGIPASGGGCFTYLVTVAHAADAMEGRDTVVGLNRVGGGTVDILIPKGTKWWYHPTERDRVDAAVLPCPLPEEADFCQVPVAMFLTDEAASDNHIGPGDVTFCPGLFRRMAGRERYLPVVRTGNVAMMPTETLPGVSFRRNVTDMEAYLIEARSMSGFSGSPVFVRGTASLTMNVTTPTGPTIRSVVVQTTSSIYLMGLVHGHWNLHPGDHDNPDFQAVPESEKSIALGMAVVVPAKKVLEILNQPDLVAGRNDQERQQQQQSGTTCPD